MDIAFAFGGQINWMRYITTMKQRSKFAAAASLTTGRPHIMIGFGITLACSFLSTRK
jgi:hypothetical protein